MGVSGGSQTETQESTELPKMVLARLLSQFLIFCSTTKEGRHNHLQQGPAKLPQPVPLPQPISSPCLCDRSGLSLLYFLFSFWWFLSWEHINLVQFSVFITIFVTQVEHQNVNASYLLWRIVEFSIALTFPMFCISIGSGSWWLMIITIITPRDSKYKLPNVQRKPLETFNRILNNLCPNVPTSSIRHPSVSRLGEIQPRLQPEE